MNTVGSTSPFVGRTEEINFLGQVLSEAGAGAGRFVTIAGDPGMGKTRLMAEVATLASEQGKRVLWSQMIEDPGTPPYFLWIPALRACLRQFDDESLLADLGSGAADLASIVPELHDRLSLPAGKAPADSSAARYQLFDSVTRFLLRTTENQPLVLLLDNLHLADRSSLSLLEYFCQQLASHAVLVMGAYRDSDLDRHHALRPMLNTLSRGAGFAKILIEGLPRSEVAELLHQYLDFPPPVQMVDSVHEQSGGNPLFITEVGSMLTRREQDQQLPGAGFHYKVPESLQDVIMARLDSLPAETCRLLGVAAVLGREFNIAFLCHLGKIGSERATRILQPAITAGVVAMLGPGSFRFHHALFREVLYAEHSTVSRVMLHRKAGDYLEGRYRDDLQAHLSQIAHHYFEAAQAGGENKSVNYCRRAAEAATQRRAYSEAVALYERALQALELDPDPNLDKRFELLLSLGHSHYRSGQLNTSTQTLMKAVILAYRQRWWERLASALFAFQNVCQQSGLRHVASVPLHETVLEHLPKEATALRARVHASMAKAYRTAAKPEQAAGSFRTSVALARESGDPNVLLDCLRKGAWTVGRQPSGVREGLDISYEALELAKIHGPTEAVFDALSDIVFQLCDLGEMTEMKRNLAELRSLSLRERQPHFFNVLVGFETAAAILQGHWQEAMRSARESVSQVPLQGVLGLEGRFAFQMFAVKKAQGSLGEFAGLAERIIEASSGSQLWLPGQVALHCELNQPHQAHAALEQLGNLRELPRDDLYPLALVYLAESCTRLRDIPRCTQLMELLTPYRGLNMTLAGTLMLGAASGYLALLAAATDNLNEAKVLFEEALEMNSSMGAAPVLAGTQVEYARLLLRGGSREDQRRAGQLLSEAGRIARELSLKPVLNAIESIDAGGGIDSLTRRETEVLKLIAEGSSNIQIAEALYISHSTVATHVRNIFRKTGAANRTEAADHARRAGLLRQA